MTTEASLAKPKEKTAAQKVQTWMTQPVMQKSLAAALAGYMDEATFAAQCYIAAQDEKLQKCTGESLMRAFLECAQMGLLPGRHHRHVAMVPYGGVIEVTPQWQGFKFLMERQPGIKRVHAQLVHVNDKFVIEHGEPVHEYDPFDDSRVFEHPDVSAKAKCPATLRGGYLTVEYSDGRPPLYHFVSAAKIDKNRRCAKQQNVWTAWFEEMALKTVLRDAWSKRVISIDPMLAERLGRADVRDNEVSESVPMPGGADVKVEGSRTKALVARVDAIESNDEVPDMSQVPSAPDREPGADDEAHS